MSMSSDFINFRILSKKLGGLLNLNYNLKLVHDLQEQELQQFDNQPADNFFDKLSQAEVQTNCCAGHAEFNLSVFGILRV